MKKLLVFMMAIMLAGSSVAQIFFFEDFDFVGGPTSGGAGTYSFPPGWSLRNVDNSTPDAQVSYVNNAWTRREDFKFNVQDSCAFSTSWYAPVGSANDFMWTPLIGPLPDHCQLSWNAVAYDVAYPDGYEIRVMTVPPTGGSGSIGNQLTNSTVVFSISAENPNWTQRTADLNAFAGQAVYIGFRNNSNDKFVLLIDDIKVERVINYDARLWSTVGYEYSMYPLRQVGQVALGGTILNAGMQALTNVNMVANIYNSSNTLVHTQSSTPVATLASGAIASFSLPSWTPSAKGNYIIKYHSTSVEPDLQPANDTMIRTIIITDSVYARDDGTITGNLGIGQVGYIGQAYAIGTTTDINSVSVVYNRGYTGRKYGFVIWNTTATGVPNAIIASTDTLLYENDDAFADTIPTHGGKKTLLPGNYVITAIEFDSTLALATTNEVFTLGTLWVSWNTQPWANLEAFGPFYRKPLYMRLNVSTPVVLPVTLVAFTGRHTQTGNKLQWSVAEQQGIISYEVERSADGIGFRNIGSVPANTQASYTYDFLDRGTINASAFYRLKIVEYNKVSYSRVIHLRPLAGDMITVAPNPVKQLLTIEGNDPALLNTLAGLWSMNGKQVKQISITQLPLSVDMSSLPGGMYMLKFYDGSVVKVVKQ
jgi:hypothetical protein